jgi:hypothetical protein
MQLVAVWGPLVNPPAPVTWVCTSDTSRCGGAFSSSWSLKGRKTCLQSVIYVCI